MDLDGQAKTIPGQWPTATTDLPDSPTHIPPPAVIGVASGGITAGKNNSTESPIDPHDFYLKGRPLANAGPAISVTVAASRSRPEQNTRQSPRHERQQITPPRSYSRSPSRAQNRTTPGSAASTQRKLNNARSIPVLAGSRHTGSVRDIANKFDATAATDNTRSTPLQPITNRARSRPPTTRLTKGIPTLATSNITSNENRPSTARLTKKKPMIKSSAEMPSATTSFETNSSFSSTTTALSTKSQPPMQQHVTAKPLFGEITADGRWNGNFDISNYAPLPAFNSVRRSSEGNFNTVHTRSQSHQNFSQKSNTQWQAENNLVHARSRSDLDNTASSTKRPTASRLPTSASSRSSTRSFPNSSTTRLPMVRTRQSMDSVSVPSRPQSRPASRMSNPATRIPTVTKSTSSPPASPSRSQEGTPKPGVRRRYSPPTFPPPQQGQTLSAKIVAPLPKTSPPLRSSRPRQPVSSATTSASRARAAEKFQHVQNPAVKDPRRPSEQWLGQPYDPQKEQTRRKIPELGNINFAERRDRIQKAISQNLETTRSEESLRKASRSFSNASSKLSIDDTPVIDDHETLPGAENLVDRHQAELFDQETDALSRHTTPRIGYPQRLSVDTQNVPPPTGQRHGSEDDLRTAATAQTEMTIFEDESPVFGTAAFAAPKISTSTPEPSMPEMLTTARYQVPQKSRTPPPPIIITNRSENEKPDMVSPSVLENVMSMRRQSDASKPPSEPELSPDFQTMADNQNVFTERWANLSRDIGSIKIMLDNDRRYNEIGSSTDPRTGQSRAEHTDGDHSEDSALLTPTNDTPIAETASCEMYGDDGSDGVVARTLRHYQSTGSITAEMYQDLQHHMVDLHRLSANGGSNAIVIQNLLDSILEQQSTEQPIYPADDIKEQHLTINMPQDLSLVTPDTPRFEDFTPGHVLVYGADPQPEDVVDEEEDFEAKIRKADEEWERHQRGEEQSFLPSSTYQTSAPPRSPPKDAGYTPRTTSAPNSATFPSAAALGGLRISSLDADRIPESQLRNDDIPSIPVAQLQKPSHSPPNVPSGVKLPPSETADSGRASSELFPPQPWRESVSSRPSMDSQRRKPVPSSQSVTSFADSYNKDRGEIPADGTQQQSANTPPPASPEHKRLLRRKHIIKELIDTENTYHQDLKIIEDIYKATCSPDLVQPEDKKVLFGNCDEIERFALGFYDELRKAANPVYVPNRAGRLATRRNSESTTQSDTNPVAIADNLDAEKDRGTSVGKCFLAHIPRMEHMYGAYLKNHDAANKRLDAIQDIDTVKCWLDECHKNASDITTAWDLDSLLVKPTQRVAKYPMLVQQLLEVTPVDHPDHNDLKSAAIGLVEMLTRINDAKKRADLVDSIINRKRKDSDMRSGIAKAFGRRTEKLKERVGIAEAFQDPEFDELAHKFGGHFIRLQICMRDVQDYVSRTSNAVDVVANFAAALDQYTDVQTSQLPEIEAKWRRYGQVIRDLTNVAFAEHKAAVQKRVLEPMVACIKLHHGPQNAINKRKKRVVDYARVKSDERRGTKPDKKTAELAEMYVALNDQLKIELPRLYSLTTMLVQNCLICFIDVQKQWQNTWERKLRPVLEEADIPQSIEQIESAFKADFLDAENRCMRLSICNGTLKAETASFLSGTTAVADRSDYDSARFRPSASESSTLNGDASSIPGRRSSHEVPRPSNDSRLRSDSGVSARTSAGPPGGFSGRPWSNSASHTPNTSYPISRPGTSAASTPAVPAISYAMTRTSSDNPRSPSMTRPGSSATYFTARPERDSGTIPAVPRFSGIFTSALPPDLVEPTQPQISRQPPPSNPSIPRSSSDLPISSTPNLPQPTSTATTPSRPASPLRGAPADTPILFVCASLFEFSIARTRREGGYPYLTYVSGEVFDVVAQKGELWLARNQDDPAGTLGWIWEQHFIVLSTPD